jgi:NHL repeat
MATSVAIHESTDPSINAGQPTKTYWLAAIVLCGLSLLSGCGSSSGRTSAPPPTHDMPYIYSISPAIVMSGGSGGEFFIVGGGLGYGSIVTLNGAPRQTIFSEKGPNGPDLEVSLSAADLATPACNTLEVTNPAPGGGTSNAANLVVASTSSPIYVTDTNNRRVQVFDNNGNYVGQFSHSFDLPTGIALDCNGNVYVMDGNTHCVVDKFDSNGNFLLEFGQCVGAPGPGTFDNAGRVATDAAGNVWVTSPSYYYMQKYDSSGQFQSIICMASTGVPNCPVSTPIDVQPQGIAIDAVGSIFLINVDPSTGPNLIVFGNTGEYLNSISGLQITDSSNADWSNIEIASDAYGYGEVQVTDPSNNRVEVIDFLGINAFQFGSQGTGNGQFEGPAGIASDAAGNLFLTDVGNNRIEKFDISGTYLSQFGTSGSGNGQFAAPYGIAIVP